MSQAGNHCCSFFCPSRCPTAAILLGHTCLGGPAPCLQKPGNDVELSCIGGGGLCTCHILERGNPRETEMTSRDLQTAPLIHPEIILGDDQAATCLF